MLPLRLTPWCRLALATLLVVLPFLPLIGDDKPAPRLELRPGDHICIIGNTLADRMQHDGWLETYFHSRFPEHDLVFRNLGFSGDELTLRLRSMDFGTPDQWLAGSAPVPQPGKLVTRRGVRDNRFETTETNADVVFAFFGYNESFAGEAGLDKFKKDLDTFIKHTLGQKYNGKTAPRLVLFSPIAHEDLKDKNLPDGSENNKRLEMYGKAMAEVAAKNGVVFVDLFGPTRALYPRAEKPLTINGVHLNERGNEAVAKVIDQTLFAGKSEPKRDPKQMEKLRQAVRDQNFHWFNRYRMVDGYNVHGARAFEKYQDKQSNYEDQQRELEILDVMTANREKRVWALAKGQDRKVDDSNTPPFIPVQTNLRDKNGNPREITFLDGEEAIKKMTVGKNMKVTLFASEKEFPHLLEKPVQMQFDNKGRLWVAVWPSYPHWKPLDEMNDKILVFEDTRGTGKADKCTVFADKLHCPTGFEFYNGGVLVAQAPDLMFLKDTDGDGKADVRQRVLHGLDSADTHHTANSFALDPGGALYFQEGTFHHSQTETAYGPSVRVANGAVFRYEPRTQKFGVYVSTGFANPHGHVWDRWGRDVVYDGTGAQPYDGALFSGHLNFPDKHPKPPQVYDVKGIRPCPGVEMLTSRHFPQEMQGNLLVANVIGFQGIRHVKLSDAGSSFAGQDVDPILSSSDPNFRPSDLKIGPDGAIWFIDWHNPIIGHLQHALRDPNRDRTHGRIYRVTYEGRDLLKPPAIAGQPIDKLLDLLKEPEDRVRYRAKIELGGRDSAQVIAAVKKWVDKLDTKDPHYDHNLLEALWVHQYHNVVNVDLLKRMLECSEARARAAATRVLCYWHDRVPDALELLKKQAADQHPRVRLEAVRAASFLTVPEAMEVVLITNEHPGDHYLDFVRRETNRALDPYVKKAIADGKEIRFTTPAGSRYFLKNVGTDDLVKMKRTPAVFHELLLRKGVRDEFRKEAVSGLAKVEKKAELQVLLDALKTQDGQDDSAAFDLVRLLSDRGPAELAGVRPDLEKMATGGARPLTRELGWVALVAADGGAEKAWALAVRSAPTLIDFVNAMPYLRDPNQRAALYAKVEPLLAGLPKELTGAGGATKGTLGRYVRIELPGRQKTLTLAEVEVISEGRNVTRRAKASQSSTDHGGEASRAIDGNRSGKYGDGGQTHTQERSNNPWWEVDLLAEVRIDSVNVYNRTDEDLGKRLGGFTLKVLDSDRKPIFTKSDLPAPVGKASYAVGSESPERLVRRAAMAAVTTVRGKEADAFKALAKYVADDVDRQAAVQAILRIPAARRPREEAAPVLDKLLAYVRKVPANERTTPAVLDALQLADQLAALLPRDEAKKVRKELGELGVRVVRVGTVVEQMRYDVERIVVQAGKPIEIVFENIDLMPHNLVVTEPGAMEEIGNLAEELATQPGAAERQYVPKSPKVLFQSKLLQPRDVQVMQMTAPAKPGVYPYVCTYPGHWRRMHGALYVVEDLDEYLADAEGYLAKHPLPIKDELLKYNRPRTEWKFEDLASSIDRLEGRSYSNGKQMFQVAACISCHKLENVGQEFGPDLTKPDPKFTHSDILREVLDPSFRINEKYQTWLLELKSGKVVTGVILEETKETVKVIENPLTKAEPILLKPGDIAERRKSPTSMMPKGLLDKLTREEILDLMAYVLAKGDPRHKAFQGGHDHGHKH